MAEQGNYIRRNFFTIFISLFILLAIGVAGYMIIEEWDWIDALYMTVISFSTVGFREVGTLKQSGRIFTMVIIFGGLVLLAMLSASVTSFLIQRELLPKFRTKKMKKEIERLQGHTILCGAGETSKTIIEEFIHSRKSLVVIDINEEVLENLREVYPSLLVVNGDATKDEVLEEANIKNAVGLITALRDDADNLFVVLSARAMKPNLTIVTRAVDAHTKNKMYKAGATHVVSPNITEGSRMAAMILRPTVVSFLDIMMREEKMAFRMEEITLPVGSSFHGKALRELEIPQRTGLIVIAIEKQVREGTQLIYNPQSSTIINENDKFIVLGDIEKIEKLQKLMEE